MSSIDTLAKRVLERGGTLSIKYCRGNATKLNYWAIDMSLPVTRHNDELYEFTHKMILGGLDEPLSKVANKANGVFK